MKTRKWFQSILFATLALGLAISQHASASLTTFQTFTGNVAVSTDGFGSTTQAGTISAQVPAGATVLGAYLYTAVFRNPTHVGVSGTLNGVAVPYGASVPNPSPSGLACCSLSSARADVTAIVAPVINGGPGGIYNFAVTEGVSTQDGEALVVVYSLASLPVATVGILDGFSDVLGDTASINFSTALDPTAPGFFAEMRIGDSFSCCGQQSTVTVNGTLISNQAGNNDDGLQVSDGSLITVGGFDDPFSPFLPSYADDHERYNLVPQITLGDMAITVDTRNPDATDNIFLEVFHVAGIAGVNAPPPDTTPSVPEPSSLALFGLGLLSIFARRKKFTA